MHHCRSHDDGHRPCNGDPDRRCRFQRDLRVVHNGMDPVLDNVRDGRTNPYRTLYIPEQLQLAAAGELLQWIHCTRVHTGVQASVLPYAPPCHPPFVVPLSKARPRPA